jgi:hypothetical protein
VLIQTPAPDPQSLPSQEQQEQNEEFEALRDVVLDGSEDDIEHDPLSGNSIKSSDLGSDDDDVTQEEPASNIPEWRQNVLIQENEAGVKYNKHADDCYHLNSSWKGGVCTIQGNAACPFLGGNQRQCPHYVSKADEIERRRSLPESERYRLTHVDQS